MNRWGYDEVLGTVIGEICKESHYGFFVNGKQFDSGNFLTDADAKEFIRINYPDKFTAGCELRCYY